MSTCPRGHNKTSGGCRRETRRWQTIPGRPFGLGTFSTAAACHISLELRADLEYKGVRLFLDDGIPLRFQAVGVRSGSSCPPPSGTYDPSATHRSPLAIPLNPMGWLRSGPVPLPRRAVVLKSRTQYKGSAWGTLRASTCTPSCVRKSGDASLGFGVLVTHGFGGRSLAKPSRSAVSGWVRSFEVAD